MPHQVRTNIANVTLPGGLRIDSANTTITLTDADFSLIPSGSFGSAPLPLTDLGYVGPNGDAVVTQAAFVAAVGALTSSQVATANATDLASAQTLANALKTAYNALQTDVATLRTAVNAELAALQGVGRPQAAS